MSEIREGLFNKEPLLVRCLETCDWELSFRGTAREYKKENEKNICIARSQVFGFKRKNNDFYLNRPVGVSAVGLGVIESSHLCCYHYELKGTVGVAYSPFGIPSPKKSYDFLLDELVVMTLLGWSYTIDMNKPCFVRVPYYEDFLKAFSLTKRGVIYE